MSKIAERTGSKVRAKLVELWTRLVEYDKDEKIYNNGHNNLYPNEIERVVGNSPTANRSSIMLAKYIAGKGLRGKNPVVNKQKNLRLNDIVKGMARSIAVQNGFYLHIGYGLGEGGKWTPNKLTVVDYVRCRISKQDDNDYPNKIWVHDWEKQSTSSGRLSQRIVRQDKTRDAKKKWYYPYNPDQEIIEKQMATDSEGATDIAEKIRRYRGQVLYVNLTPDLKYALSKFDGVYNDCDTEYRMSLYANTITRGGFLGKIAVLTQGLDDDVAQDVTEDIQKWLGAENSSSLYHLDITGTVEDLEKVLVIKQLESQFDDDMFVNTDKRIRRNILGAANNIPEPLIYSTDGALFGQSGETYREMKQFYTEQTDEERSVIEQTLTELGFETEIIPLYEDEEIAEREEEEEEEETTTESEETEEEEETELQNQEQ